MIKVNLKSILGLAALSMTLLANTVPTWAGFVNTPEVFISKLGTQSVDAGGSLVGARYSADRKQFIGCTVYARRNESPIIGCYARESSGISASCSSTDPGLVDQTQRMTDSSFIYFIADSSTAACKELHIVDNSDDLR
jgi:hypothetical protein